MTKVALIMGSSSDKDIVQEAVTVFQEFSVECVVSVMSAHRTPEEVLEFASGAYDDGFSSIICFAGAAAHLAGVVASHTNLPVIAVPISATSLGGLDALLASVQMPGGIPVATMAIGKAGARNSALFALQMIACNDKALYQKLQKYRVKMKEKIKADNSEMKSLFGK